MDYQIVFMVIGFCLAAYSVIGNDAIQTLGTFLSSNRDRPWWMLWLWIVALLILVLGLGWYTSGTGDASFGRLETIPSPPRVSWIYIIPPLAILVLTRFGIPVSTTFLLLTIFAPGNLMAMLTKSLLGYFVAFIVAILLYRFVINKTTRYLNRTHGETHSKWWIILQWLSTGFLWSQWLMQDLANVFVFLPRNVSPRWMLFSVIIFVITLAFIFQKQGGAIQRIVTSKTGTTDIRGATIIDFIYGIILLVFKEWSNIPMSTTWVFLGLLAGREFAISLLLYSPPVNETAHLIRSDVSKALLGLVVSVIAAVVLPVLDKLIGF